MYHHFYVGKSREQTLKVNHPKEEFQEGLIYKTLVLCTAITDRSVTVIKTTTTKNKSKNNKTDSGHWNAQITLSTYLSSL